MSAFQVVQELPFTSRGRPQVLKASERFEKGLDAPSLSDFFDGQMAQMQRSFIEMECEVETLFSALCIFSFVDIVVFARLRAR